METETLILDWIRRFILFHDKRHPSLLTTHDIETCLSSLALLLGVPDHIPLDWTPESSAVCYALCFVYLSRDLQVSYFNIAVDITFNGNLTTAVCLGKGTNDHIAIDLNQGLRDLDYDDFHNLAISQGSRRNHSSPCSLTLKAAYPSETPHGWPLARNNSLKLTRRAGHSGMLVFPAVMP